MCLAFLFLSLAFLSGCGDRRFTHTGQAIFSKPELSSRVSPPEVLAGPLPYPSESTPTYDTYSSGHDIARRDLAPLDTQQSNSWLEPVPTKPQDKTASSRQAARFDDMEEETPNKARQIPGPVSSRGPSAPFETAQDRSSQSKKMPQSKNDLQKRSLSRLPDSKNLKREGSKTFSSGRSVTVQQGDTLFSIARREGVRLESLKSANRLNGRALRVGQILKLPAKAERSPSVPAPDLRKPEPILVQKPSPAKKESPVQEKSVSHTSLPGVSGETSVKEAPFESSGKVEPMRMRWPARGRIISAYGKGQGNSRDGIDIQVPPGTPVRAAESGVVIYSGDGLKDFGNTVLIRHENGLVTVYGHASELRVKRGEKIVRGQEIAVSGMSGASESPRLHFEVRKNSAPVDPYAYLE